MAILSTYKKKEKGYKIISTGYYNPKVNALILGKEEKCIFVTYTCNCPEKCEAYKKGMCYLKNGIIGSHCPFGEVKRKIGVEPSFNKFYIILSSFQFKNIDTLNKLSPIHRIVEVGNTYIYLPLHFLDNNTNPISNELKIINSNLLPKENFTIENIIKLIMYRPTFPNGDVMSVYIEKDIPNFVFQLKLFYPEIYEEVCKKIVNIEKEVLPKINYINKFAKVKTLNPGPIKMGNFMCYWNGQEITCRSSTIKDLFNIKSKEEMHIIPYAGTVCQVIDEKTVNESTEFV